MRADDLAGLLSPEPGDTFVMRQGTIVAWDPATGSNQVRVGDSVLDDLPFMDLRAGVRYLSGDIVALLQTKTQMMVLGRMVDAESDISKNAGQVVDSAQAGGSLPALSTTLSPVASSLIVVPPWARRALVNAFADFTLLGDSTSHTFYGGIRVLATPDGSTASGTVVFSRYGGYQSIAANALHNYAMPWGATFDIPNGTQFLLVQPTAAVLNTAWTPSGSSTDYGATAHFLR